MPTNQRVHSGPRPANATGLTATLNHVQPEEDEEDKEDKGDAAL